MLRLLDRWSPVEAARPRQDVAERLGQWLRMEDAITLHETHQSLRSLAPDHDTSVADAAGLGAELAALRARIDAVIGAEAVSPDAVAGDDYAPFHQRYLQHQRLLATRVDALRIRARTVLAAVSPRLAQLVALDTTLEQLFGRREQQLLSTVPAFLRARFEQLKEQHAEQMRGLFPPAPDAWRATFAADFRETLLAELEHRLQPVAGLIEAHREEVKPRA